MAAAFDGQLALVTGASRGIGAAIAQAPGRGGGHGVLTPRTAAGPRDPPGRDAGCPGAAPRDRQRAGPGTQIQNTCRIGNRRVVQSLRQ